MAQGKGGFTTPPLPPFSGPTNKKNTKIMIVFPNAHSFSGFRKKVWRSQANVNWDDWFVPESIHDFVL